MLSTIRCTAAAVLCTLLVGGTASADNLDASAIGAALALPILTTSPGGDRVTIHTITNALHEPISLHLNVLSGDPEDGWDANNYDCPLSPRETTWIVFQNNGDQSDMTFECSAMGVTNGSNPALLNIVKNKSPKAANGILFVTVEWIQGQNPDKGTRLEDALLGDAVVLDYGQGYAFSVPAITIQKGQGNPPAGDPETLDTLYKFDDVEYKSFPSALVTNFIAPDGEVTAELLLFTLDGSVGQGSVPVGIDVDYYDDDEEGDSGSFDFDCFVLRHIDDSLDGLGAGITASGLGSIVGQIQLVPSATVLPTDVHDTNPLVGNGNNRRIRPVHGWIIQTTPALGDVIMMGNRSVSPAAWARPLNQGTLSLVTDGPGADISAFEGR